MVTLLSVRSRAAPRYQEPGLNWAAIHAYLQILHNYSINCSKIKLATVAQVLVFFFVREQRRLQRAQGGMTTSLYVFSRKNTISRTVCR